MSGTIVMRHPTLPAHQEIEVPKDAMPHYTSAGWQLVPAEELQRRADEQAKAAAEAAAAETSDEPEQSEPAEASTERPARSRAKAHDKKTEE